MPQEIATIERHLMSKHKEVRLKALKLLFRHPDATPLQLVRGLCSDDNRNFEFVQTFELHAAMRASWSRLRGVTEDSVYEFLCSLYAADPSRNVNHVINVLQLICTRKALDILQQIRVSAPVAAHWSIGSASSYISSQLASKDS